MQTNDIRTLPRRRIAAAVLTLFSASSAGIPAFAAGGGEPIGSTIYVLNEPTQQQHYGYTPSIARNAGGQFVVVWSDLVTRAVYARRYAADGSPLDDGFQVSSPGTGASFQDALVDRMPEVALDAAGDFVIAWRRDQQAYRFYYHDPIRGPGQVFARRYTADGVPAGAEFAVDATSRYIVDGFPSVAMDSQGNFTVAWGRASGIVSQRVGNGPLGPMTLAREDIVAQRYRADGTLQGERLTADSLPSVDFEFTSNFLIGVLGIDRVKGALSKVDVAMDDQGDFTVAWSVGTGYSTPSGIFARQYRANQAPKTAIITASDGAQGASTVSVASDNAGDFVLVWNSGENGTPGRGQYGNASSIVGRRFQSGGQPSAPNFVVAAPTDREEFVGQPAVASDAAGNFAVSWFRQLSPPSASSTGAILAQLYRGS